MCHTEAQMMLYLLMDWVIYQNLSETVMLTLSEPLLFQANHFIFIEKSAQKLQNLGIKAFHLKFAHSEKERKGRWIFKNLKDYLFIKRKFTNIRLLIILNSFLRTMEGIQFCISRKYIIGRWVFIPIFYSLRSENESLSILLLLRPLPMKWRFLNCHIYKRSISISGH